VNYFTERGSCVYAAALDLSKAFDSVNHFKLFSALLKSGLPVGIINVICNWYGKLFAAVRWCNALSDVFHVGSGVRQGGSLSPALFNVFINIFVIKLRLLDVGCHINSIFFGCFLYADDLIVLSPSVIGLQQILDTCIETSNLLSLKFNCSKSHCILFGKCCIPSVEPMRLGNDNIEWVNSIKYLGVYIVSGKKLTFDISCTKRTFYASCNSVNAHAKSLEEIVQLTLHENYCLPLLTYASAALTLCSQQLNDLNVCWNTVYRLIFKFNRWESVKSFIHGLGRLSLLYIFNVARVKFFFHLRDSPNVLLYNLLWIYFADSCVKDHCLSSLLLTLNAAIDNLYTDFNNSAI
jgi:hypothetical protein